MKNLFLFSAIALVLLCCSAKLYAQQGVSINSSGAPADNSAMFEVSSTAKGALMPRMTTTERNSIVSPAQSLLIYNLTTKCFEFYENSAWQTLGCVCTAPGAAGAITGQDTVYQGQSGISYSIAAISGATSYSWSYSGSGATIIGTSNSVTINFSASATSGVLSVSGVNSCGNGTPSTKNIWVFAVQSFTSVGSQNWTVPTGVNSVKVLVVGGGGGGGASHAGGGGGGGIVYSSSYSTTPGQNISVTVGAGGTGACMTCYKTSKGTNGGDSQFGTITAIGGGAGGNRRDEGTPGLEDGSAGGSGGGGGGQDPSGGNGGVGTSGQGFAGGHGYPGTGGGGGGAGSAGITPVNNVVAGNGGSGLGFSITGQTTYYGGGGGGGAYTWPQGVGGVGIHGGGNGAYAANNYATAGATNTGGGGGGGGAADHGYNTRAGANGGSGIVIVSYIVP